MESKPQGTKVERVKDLEVMSPNGDLLVYDKESKLMSRETPNGHTTFYNEKGEIEKVDTLQREHAPAFDTEHKQAFPEKFAIIEELKQELALIQKEKAENTARLEKINRELHAVQEGITEIPEHIRKFMDLQWKVMAEIYQARGLTPDQIQEQLAMIIRRPLDHFKKSQVQAQKMVMYGMKDNAHATNPEKAQFVNRWTQEEHKIHKTIEVLEQRARMPENLIRRAQLDKEFSAAWQEKQDLDFIEEDLNMRLKRMQEFSPGVTNMETENN